MRKKPAICKRLFSNLEVTRLGKGSSRWRWGFGRCSSVCFTRDPKIDPKIGALVQLWRRSEFPGESALPTIRRKQHGKWNVTEQWLRTKNAKNVRRIFSFHIGKSMQEQRPSFAFAQGRLLICAMASKRLKCSKLTQTPSWNILESRTICKRAG